MELDSESDDIISQALDMSELTRETLANEHGQDSEGLALSLTQDRYLPKTEPVSEPSEGEEYEHLLDVAKTIAHISDSQLAAVGTAVDLTDMLDDAGPCQIATSRPVKPFATNDTKGDTSKRFEDVSAELLATRKKPNIPENTLKKNRWAVNVFTKWRDEFISVVDNRRKHGYIFNLLNGCTNTLVDMSDADINTTMCLFIIALRKTDGKEYKGESILSIICGIQRHLRYEGRDLDFFQDTIYKDLKTTLDTTMQDKCAKGIKVSRKQVQIITPQTESVLWEKGFLGVDSPQRLYNTFFWMIGLNFGLRGGQEHRSLTFNNFDLKVDSSGCRYLEYTQSVNKTYTGGLKNRNTNPHSARAYENKNDRKKCPVSVFELYESKLPPNRDPTILYFKPLLNVKDNVWFSHKPVGKNTLEEQVKSMMKAAAIEGYFTNHSLRASTASRLYHAGVDEQIIMEQTGHRSNAVQAYKRTSDDQKRKVSEILLGIDHAGKRPRSVVAKCSPETAGSSNDSVVLESKSPEQTVHLVLNNCSNVNIKM